MMGGFHPGKRQLISDLGAVVLAFQRKVPLPSTPSPFSFLFLLLFFIAVQACSSQWAMGSERDSNIAAGNKKERGNDAMHVMSCHVMYIGIEFALH